MAYAVRFQDVFKEYPFYQHITAGFKSFLFNLPKNISSLKQTRFVALNGVSFEVGKGETFGIIGKNGSGKSTILSLIAGVIRQDRGAVDVDGRISSLLELGAGFHPDLSGIENIILNGILMGNTREEMVKRIDRIIEFAELGDFIYQPLRTYSSGMYVRLGFSVAIHIEPEILLVDEALAVGDLSFQKKCMEKMYEFKKSGATIILVSHDMTPVARLCDTVVWIDSGRVMSTGRPLDTIRKYMSYTSQKLPVSPPGEELVSDNGQRTSPDTSAIHHKETSEAVLSEPSVSWWDIPFVLSECETRITGNSAVSFYDYLKSTVIHHPLEKGLSIGSRLKGIQSNFVLFDVCKSFDYIEDADALSSLPAKPELKNNCYDLLLSIDTLHRVKQTDSFLRNAADSLKKDGILIALEYVGPEGFAYTTKETDIADMLYHLIKNTNEMIDVDTLKPSAATTLTDSAPDVRTNATMNLTGRFFDIIAIRPFGGPLLDLLLNRILIGIDLNDEKDLSLMKTIVGIDRMLVQEGVLQNRYAMIVGKKKTGSHN